LLRLSGPPGDGLVLLRGDHQMVGESDLAHLIQEQVRHFESRGQDFEWKTFAHDQSLEASLLSQGFVPGAPETVLVARAKAVPLCPLPEGVRVREAHSHADFESLAQQQRAAFGGDHRAQAERSRVAVETDPERVVVLLAEARGQVVGSARVEFVLGTEFATLWAGSTAPEARHRGIYSSLVALRAQMARHRGYHLLEVEALATSRPILERLGFIAVTRTTPFSYQAAAGRGRPVQST